MRVSISLNVVPNDPNLTPEMVRQWVEDTMDQGDAKDTFGTVSHVRVASVSGEAPAPSPRSLAEMARGHKRLEMTPHSDSRD